MAVWASSLPLVEFRKVVELDVSFTHSNQLVKDLNTIYA